MIKVLSLVATCMAVISFSGFAAEAPSTAAANPYEQNIVRLSKITVAPEYLDQYKAFAAEVGRESMKREPGVRVLYSMQEKKNPTRFAILEIYANQEAYQHHIQTPHFRKYKEGTLHMVTSLELIDCDARAYKAIAIFDTDTHTASAGGCFAAVSIQAFFSQNRLISIGLSCKGVSLDFQIFLYPKGGMLHGFLFCQKAFA